MKKLDIDEMIIKMLVDSLVLRVEYICIFQGVVERSKIEKLQD
jgi:hypothetical protein